MNLTDLTAGPDYNDNSVIINESTAEVVDIEGEVSDIMVADPGIVDVTVLQSNRLYIVGLGVGTTNIIAVDAEGDVLKKLNIHVIIDTNNIQRIINQLFPEENIKVDSLRAQIILSGSASTPDVAQQVSSILTHYLSEVEGASRTPDEAIVNLMTVKGKSQVMLRVKIMEVSRTLLKERGNDTTIDDLGLDFGDNVENSPRLADVNSGNIFDTTGENVLAGVVETGITETPFATFGLLESFGALGPIDTIISLLEENGLAKILAEPNLTAISGEQAGFLAGGEYPVPSGRDTQGNIEVIFRQFGVSLTFLPVVMSEDRISLQFETEVSSLSRENQVTLADIEVPGLDIRRASTTVEMGSGKTLMIAGLLSSQTVNSLSGIPGMTRAPVISQLMSSESFRRDETEMVVLVTPYLVEPYSDDRQAQKIPKKDKERFELAKAFSRNIRRTYGDLRVSDLFEGDQSYGYLID